MIRLSPSLAISKKNEFADVGQKESAHFAYHERRTGEPDETRRSGAADRHPLERPGVIHRRCDAALHWLREFRLPEVKRARELAEILHMLEPRAPRDGMRGRFHVRFSDRALAADASIPVSRFQEKGRAHGWF